MAQNQGKDGQNAQQDKGMSQQSQQSGQQGNQQHGGQHASGGTPALDDLDGQKKGESAQDAAQVFDKQDSGGKNR